MNNALKKWALSQWLQSGAFRRRLLLFVLGLIAGTGFAPLHLLPAWLVGWTGLIWIADRRDTRRAIFLDSWLWGLGLTIPGIYWITSSFLIDAERFGWLAPPVLVALGAYLALYPAAAVLVAWHARSHALGFVLALASTWTLAEWARGLALTGFPWNLAAYVWAFSEPMMQSASLWGAWGLSLLTVLVTGALAVALGRTWRDARWPLVLAAALLGGLFAFGQWRLSQPLPAETGIVMRLVQANIAQWDKLTGRDRAGQVTKHLDLSFGPFEGASGGRFGAVIWPETAATLFLDREPAWRRLIGEAAPNDGYVITGALRGDPAAGDPERYWNSLYALDHRGELRASFDKFHLVPLGEYVPARRFLPFVDKLAGGGGNFSAGLGPVTLRLPGLPAFSPLICYEVIFPGAVLDAGDRPEWLLNITNDGWFGRSSGPYQHFASARFRSVEVGLPLIRSANSGISGVVDPLGRIVARTNLGETTVIDVALPGALPPTIFHKWGLFPAAALTIICAALSVGFTTANRSRIG